MTIDVLPPGNLIAQSLGQGLDLPRPPQDEGRVPGRGWNPAALLIDARRSMLKKKTGGLLSVCDEGKVCFSFTPGSVDFARSVKQFLQSHADSLKQQRLSTADRQRLLDALMNGFASAAPDVDARAAVAAALLQLYDASPGFRLDKELDKKILDSYEQIVKSEKDPLLKKFLLARYEAVTGRPQGPASLPYDAWGNKIGIAVVIDVEQINDFKQAMNFAGLPPPLKEGEEYKYKFNRNGIDFEMRIKPVEYGKYLDPSEINKSDISIYSGHSNWGRFATENFRGKPLDEGLGQNKLIVLYECHATAGPFDDVSKVLPLAQVVRTDRASYYSYGHKFITNLIDGISRRENWSKIAASVEHWPDPVEHRDGQQYGGNLHYPWRVDGEHLDLDKDGRSDSRDPYFDPPDPSVNSQDGPFQSGKLLERVFRYSRNSAELELKEGLVVLGGGWYGSSSQETEPVKVTRQAEGTWQIAFNRQYAQEPAALLAFAAHELSRGLQKQSGVDTDSARAKLMRLVDVEAVLSRSSFEPTERLHAWRTLIEGVGLSLTEGEAEQLFSIIEKVRANDLFARHHVHGGDWSVNSLLKAIPSEMISKLQPASRR
jgi:hypothetical protein